MQLLVPTRLSLALRRATSSQLSRAAATQPSKFRSKGAAAAAAPAAGPTPELLQKQQLQQLWELSKESSDGLDPRSKKYMQRLLEGEEHEIVEKWLPDMVNRLSDNNDFTSLEKLLEALRRLVLDKEQVPHVRLVTGVLWAAVRAKSLGSLPSSVLDWIEEAVRRLPEPIPARKESMIWLLSILRGDLPMLQQLQQESCSKRGTVGPEIEREKTLRHVALTYLAVGKKEEFRSLWSSSGTPLLAEDISRYDYHHQPAMLHYAMLRSTKMGKSDPAMLRWYAEWLTANQRTPIPEQPQFETMMKPATTALGGKMEKWKEGDRRTEKLRKWRDDYDDAELDKLVQSMLDYMRRVTIDQKHGSVKDLDRLERMLTRLCEETNKGTTVVVDWLNVVGERTANVNSLLPSHSLVVVGRERQKKGDTSVRSPKESKRIKVLEVTKKVEKKQEIDDMCALILAVATRGNLLTNDKTRPHITRFAEFLKEESKDVSQSILLKNYLNDAVLRHADNRIQPVVDHSKAAQWIDKEKKELAFTVASKMGGIPRDAAFSIIDYYSLHID